MSTPLDMNDEIIRCWKSIEARSDKALKDTQQNLVKMREEYYFKRTWRTLLRYKTPKESYVKLRDLQLWYANYFRSMRNNARRMMEYYYAGLVE